MAANKISLYNISELKSTTDDAIAPYLTSLPKPYTFKQQHYYANVRLAVGYTAVIIAGVLFYADWKLGWDATKPYTLPACVAYFVLNSFFTYWLWAVESGTIFVGVREGGQKLTLKSSIQKHKPYYKLRVLYEAPSGKKFDDREIEGQFADWFHVNGYLEKPALKQWLAKNIEVIGMADPESKQQAELADEEVDDVVISPTVAVNASGALQSDGAAASKRRPKKKV